MYWILFIGIALISYLVQSNLQSKFDKYSRMALSNGMTGREIAEKMLRDNGIYDVKVTSTPGMLTDHYNPTNKTVNLSEGVYNTCSVAAAAVAAHECGHAVQHARAYAPLQMRSALVPVVQFSSSIVQWVLLAGMFMINTFPQLLLIGICLFAMTTLFSFIRRQPSCFGMVKQCRGNKYVEPSSGTGCVEVGCIYIRCCCIEFTGYLGLLHYDIYQPPRLITAV